MKKGKAKPRLRCEECGAKVKRRYQGWTHGLEVRPRRVCKKCHDKMDEEALGGLNALFGGGSP